MDRRQTERRRQRPIAYLAVAAAPEEAAPEPARRSGCASRRRAPANDGARSAVPDLRRSVELEMPRFPHPPARVEMEVGHATGNGRDGHHYVEIAAFTVSGRLILSQRVPARRPVTR